MKVIAFNGSPRKGWNTSILLKHALEGAASEGAETELVNLYDLKYRGCISCFACKLKNGSSYGRCALNDDLTPFLRKTEEADAIVMGSPIYCGWVTGEIKSFMERLMFPYIVYDVNFSSLAKKKMPTAFLYTMGADDKQMKLSGYDMPAEVNAQMLARVFGETSLSQLVTETYQFDDYSKYVADRFNPEERAQRRETVFPKDCKKAFETGKKLVEIAKNNGGK